MITLKDVIIVIVGLAIGWTINDWRLNNRIKEMDNKVQQARAEALQKKSEVEALYTKKLQEAQNEAKKREAVIRRDADVSRAAAGRVRDELQAIKRNLPELATNACSERVIALADIFGACVERYRGMGEDAARLASDKETLIAAWPK